MSLVPRSGWDRLQDLIEALRPGDELHIGDAAQRSGLDPRTCENVLDALATRHFFQRSGEHVFVRRSSQEQP